mmetsp:Transcript_53717/g.120511  ORF Transcript_53717/g.120511 Transcript_53717/m.120511 type:complete len:287 (-) Transcript_53717:2-862(-)
MNGSTSYGSSTSLAMFSTMRAVLRMMETVLSSKPRLSSGAMTASADAYTSETKTTPASLCTVSPTVSGWPMQCTIDGTKPTTSRLSMVLHTSFMALVAASLTCGFTSHMRPATTGMMVVRPSWICAGCFSASIENISQRTRFDCHLFSPSARISGRMNETPLAEIMLQISLHSLSASMETGLALSAAASITEKRSGITNGSAAAPALVRRARRPASTPARLFAFFLSLSASAAFSASNVSLLFATPAATNASAKLPASASRASGVSAPVSLAMSIGMGSIFRGVSG